MQSTTLIFCRHGESEDNRAQRFGGHGPSPLTERGRSQARATGRQLQQEGAHALYCSDLVRARETAELIGEALSLMPQPTALLRERSVGVFTGLRFDEARERFPAAYGCLLQRDPDSAPPEGESYRACGARAAAFVEHVLLQHAGQRIVVVSHYMTLYLTVLHILGLEHSAGRPPVFVRMNNCALHRFERYQDGSWQVLSLNDSGHLTR